MERVSNKPGRNPAWTEPAVEDRGESDAAELYRRLYERAVADRDEALLKARRFESAWEASVARRAALERALQRLLDASRHRWGYSPRVFIARLRATAALRGIDPLD